METKVLQAKVSVVLKVLISSAGLAVVIKYAAPALAIPGTSANALIFVLTPTVVMAILLAGRAWQYQRKM
jgi:hypothetical protein